MDEIAAKFHFKLKMADFLLGLGQWAPRLFVCLMLYMFTKFDSCSSAMCL